VNIPENLFRDMLRGNRERYTRENRKKEYRRSEMIVLGKR
jgi:hypothetical protein